MCEPREHHSWTIDASDASDDDLLRAMFDLADEASCLHRRTGEIALRLDHLAAIAGDRWAPEAFQRLEQQELDELTQQGAR